MRFQIAFLMTCYAIVSTATGAASGDPANVASALVAAGSTTKESKQQFLQRFGASYRQLAATELMTQEVVGYAWHSMTPMQRAEFTQLYEKIVMGALHGAHDAALPARFTLVNDGPYRGKAGRDRKRCDLLQKTECSFYSAKAKANAVTMVYRLIETERGWKVVDILINEISIQEIYDNNIQEALKSGTDNALNKLRARIESY